jgi:AraC-like DNA-binding protein
MRLGEKCVAARPSAASSRRHRVGVHNRRHLGLICTSASGGEAARDKIVKACRIVETSAYREGGCVVGSWAHLYREALISRLVKLSQRHLRHLFVSQTYRLKTRGVISQWRQLGIVIENRDSCLSKYSA